jgi:hypothetical protein
MRLTSRDRAQGAWLVSIAALLAACGKHEQETAERTTSASTGGAVAPAPGAAIDTSAIGALNRMGAYLRTLKAFQVRASTTNEDVLADGQKVGITSHARRDQEDSRQLLRAAAGTVRPVLPAARCRGREGTNA